jgi:deazaflavin-dependent oxidoreductase (nitroreductase family)
MPLTRDIADALDSDTTIDITTTGRRSGTPSRIEIWFKRVGGRTYITGTPGPRDWYANVRAEPRIQFHIKESLVADLSARVRLITDADERASILGAPEMNWYQRQVDSVDELVSGSPLVEVLFDDEFDPAACPLCGEPNSCAEAGGSPSPCWCASSHFPASLLSEVPAAAVARACICRTCLETHEPDKPQEAFSVSMTATPWS